MSENKPAKQGAPPISSGKAAPKLVDRKSGAAPQKPAETKRSAGPGSGPSPIARLIAEPEKFGEILHDRAAWFDEVAAIIILVAGIVSLLAVLNTTPSATLASSWAETIRSIVGQVGAIMLSLMIMSVGLIIVLPKVGVRIRPSWRQVLLIEVAFLAFLALLHLFANDPEPRALARAGGGGGYIGWTLSTILQKPLGNGATIVVFGAIMLGCLGAVFGMRRRHVRQSLIWTRTQSSQLAERLTREPPPKAVTPTARGKMAAPVNTPTMAQPLYGATQAESYAAPTPYVPTSDDANFQEAPEPVYDDAPAPGPTRSIFSDSASSNPPPPRRDLRTEYLSPTNASSGATTTPTRSDRPAPNSQSTTPATPVSTPIAQPRPAAPVPNPAPGMSKAAEKPTASKPLSSPAPQSPPTSARPPMTVAPPSTPAPMAPQAQAEEPRKRRHFTVGDFAEVRKPMVRSTELPPESLLGDVELNCPSEKEINTNVRIIENTLLEFDIDVEIVDVKVGPTVTQYAVQPYREVTNEQGQVVMQRVRVNKVASLSSDIALALSAKTLRIQSYVPGYSYMGIEVPNRTPSVVALRPVMETETFSRAFLSKDPETGEPIDRPLVVPLGRDVSGAAFVTDLATLPHLLIAGTTGSGKSVCITALAVSLIMNNHPDRVKLVMLDPKMVELSRFNGLPHLLGPVEVELDRIIGVLRWATREMDRRYKLLEQEAVRNIEGYNRSLGKKRQAEHLPYMVIMIDEIGDLMMSRPDETERTITRLAQMARAVGMHLVVATQRPSVDIITGLIKANFPARIAFAVASGIDSRVILDTVGAESLMGRGDMLFQAPDAAGPQRVQGCFVSDQEIDQIVGYWKRWQADKTASGERSTIITGPWDMGLSRRESHSQSDTMLEDAIALAVRNGEISATAIQRQLGADLRHAAHLMDLMQDLGILGSTRADGRTREVLLKPGTDQYRKLMEQRKRQ